MRRDVGYVLGRWEIKRNAERERGKEDRSEVSKECFWRDWQVLDSEQKRRISEKKHPRCRCKSLMPAELVDRYGVCLSEMVARSRSVEVTSE